MFLDNLYIKLFLKKVIMYICIFIWLFGAYYISDLFDDSYKVFVFMVMGAMSIIPAFMFKYRKNPYKPSLTGLVFKAIYILVYAFFACVLIGGTYALFHEFNLLFFLFIMIAAFLGFELSKLFLWLSEYFENKKRQKYIKTRS